MISKKLKIFLDRNPVTGGVLCVLVRRRVGQCSLPGFSSAPAGLWLEAPCNCSICQGAFPEVTASGQLSVELEVYQPPSLCGTAH